MENRNLKTGVWLIVVYTRVSVIFAGIFTLILAAFIVMDPGAENIEVGITALFIMLAFTWYLNKLANMTGRLETKAWWWQVVLNVFGVFSLNPISAIILIYLWLNRGLFGIGR